MWKFISNQSIALRWKHFCSYIRHCRSDGWTGLEVFLVANPDILKKGQYQTMYKFRRHLPCTSAHKKPHCTCFIQENATHSKKSEVNRGNCPCPLWIRHLCSLFSKLIGWIIHPQYEKTHKTLTPATGVRNLSPAGWSLQNLAYSCQQNVTVVFVTFSLNTLGFGDMWRHRYIYFRFFATGL